MSTKKLVILLLIVVLTACRPAVTAEDNLVVEETAVASTATTPLFQNVSRAAGITQTRQGNDRAIGQAWGDYDRDGWVDFYVTDTTGPNSLFRNNGDGTFSRPAIAPTVALPDGFSGGASFADYNNDGWLDLYVANWGQNVLFRNDAGQGFTDVTDQAGVGGQDANSQTASWGDFDSDGWLDLYVANWACYPRCGRPSQGDSDRLYHNNGDGTFTDVTRLLGGETYGAGFVASFTDYDNDGDQDIYLINDEFLFPTGNKLWRNDGPGCDDAGAAIAHCFTQIAPSANADTQVMGMGLATADYDNDGDFDFYFSNAGPMTLLQNQGDGTFADVAEQAGVDLPDGIAWAASALDYDNDGWQDLYLAVMTTASHDGIAANPLFHNNGDGTFSRVSSGSGANDIGPTMGIAVADFDNDGRIDLLLGNKDDGYSLLRNQSSRAASHWLTLALAGAGSVNRDAVGSRVTVRTADGNVQMREVQNGSSLGAGHELRLHFGLGAFDTVEELTIRWPDGRSQTFTNISANRQINLPYPLNAAAETAQQTALYPPAEPASNPLTSHSLTLNLLLAANTIVWLALFLLILRTRHQLGINRQTMQWAGLFVIVLITAVYLITARQTADNEPPQAATAPTTLTEKLSQAGAIPPLQLPAASEAEIALGRALFWDPILSGNKDTACVTCHHPIVGTGDGIELPIGTGGQGLGPDRAFVSSRQVLVPRNATPIYNLGLDGMDVMFWDGRVSLLPDGQFDSPANDDLPYNLTNAVAVQAMFPVTSQDEMRGHPGDTDIFGDRNGLGNLKSHQATMMWDELMAELLALPAYQALFRAAYPTVLLDELDFGHAANALAAYQMDTFTFLDSPWDRYLLGDESALSDAALAGAKLFYGEAGCADCHSGSLLSDMQFHNIGVPQIGPGKGNEEPYDFGRARETGDESDLFAFRTPPLRNVAITGPWMHNGAYSSLEAAIWHHLNPQEAVENYDFDQLSPLVLAEDSGDTAVHTAALNAPSFAIPSRDLTDAEVAALLAFLESLTSPSALDLSHTIPDSVPSGLQVGGNIQ